MITPEREMIATIARNSKGESGMVMLQRAND
jgi:hypothetical protein